MEQSEQPEKDQIQESAVSYYSKNRKRSFLFTRITVVASMCILVIALGVNIYALSSQNQGTGKTNAATKENPVKLLPKIPAGCKYQQLSGGLTVVCPTAAPASEATSPINVVLPQLPPQCRLESMANGSAVQCSSPSIPIPTAQVPLPKSCTIATRPDAFTCLKNGTQETVSFPSLPKGCEYNLVEGNYYVACNAD